MPSKRTISRREFCLVTGISSASLRKYVSRGDIREVRKGEIHLDDEVNKARIIKYASKKGLDLQVTLYPEPKEEVEQVEIEEESEPQPEKPTKPQPKNKRREAQTDLRRHTESQLRTVKTEKEVAKLEVETKLKKLELEKKRSKVLPLEFVIEWSSLSMKGVFGETVNFGNTIIESICNDLEADTELKLKYKKKFKQGFNEILREGIKNQEPEAIEQAKEYSLQTKW